SAFRMDDDALIILDPLNSDAIQKALESGIKKFCGGNCTVSLLLLALQGLIEKGEIEWVNSMSYQAASGAGAEGINGLIKETQDLMSEFNLVDSALDNERHLSEKLLLKEELTFDAPLAFSLIPFIDEPLFDGETREEWKAGSESARILGEKSFPVDGLCVRVPTLRAHAQALLIKTKSELQASEVEEILSQGNEWLHVIPNTAEESRSFLNPIAVSGKLDINIGRIKKVKHDSHLITAFTVGDQLVWGAAEPLRRMLNIAKKHLL
ncbi:MAG: aspartate-semialdehyde dehydrogenase, partial [Bacteriovoracaceae bacterium]